MQADLQRRVLPEKHVMLEIDRHAAVKCHVQDGHELTLEPVADPGRRPLRDLSGQDLGCRRHGCSVLSEMSARWRRVSRGTVSPAAARRQRPSICNAIHRPN